MKKKTLFLTALVLFSTPALAAIPDVSINNLPDETTLEEGVNIQGSASGSDLNEIRIRVRDAGGSLWTAYSTNDCEGQPTCYIETTGNYTPSSTGEKEISIFVNTNSNEANYTTPQTVNFVQESSGSNLDVTMEDFSGEADVDEDFTFDVSATGDSLDQLTVEYREEGGDWTELSTKDCEDESACYFNPATYTPDSTQEVDFRATVTSGSDTARAGPQSITFVDSSNIDSNSLSNLPDRHQTSSDMPVGASASGNSLDSIEIRVDDGDGWTTYHEKDCNNLDQCSINDIDYSTDDEGDVSFKARVNAGSDQETTSAQTVEFYDPELRVRPESPINNDVVTIPVEIDWTVENPENLDLEYDLRVEDDDGDTVHSADGLTGTSYTLNDDLGDGEYEWIVEAIDSNGNERDDARGSFEIDDDYVDDISMNDLPNQQLTDEDMVIEASTTGRNLDELLVKHRTDSGWETYHEKDCNNEMACSIDIDDYERNDEVDVDFKAVAKAGTGSGEDRMETDIQTVSFVDSYELEADFDYSPRNPEVDETVTFESESTGDIEEWNWDFGDGSTGSGETVQHSFDNSGEYAVELEVSDGETTADETRIVDVGDTDSDGQCSIDVGNIDVSPDRIQPGEDATVSITVENSGDAQDITVTFQVNDYVEQVEEDTLSSGETEEYTLELSRNTDADLIATVETEAGDNPCDYQRWDKTGFFNVVEDGENDATFNFDVEDEEGDGLHDVMIRGENGETFTRYTDEDGEVSADVESGTYEITASKPGYESETKTRTVDSGETENVDFTLERDEEAEDEGQLSILTEDLDGDRLEDVEITAENGDDETTYTNENGRAFLYLEEGDYTVRAEKDGYLDQARDVEIEAGERTPVLFEMVSEDEDSIRITDLDYSDTVCRGDTLTVTVSIRNSRDSDELVTFRGDGLGSSSERYVVTERGETITRELRFTNVEGSGSEDFTVSIDNSVHDEMTGEVEVESCGTSTPEQGDATGLTAEVNPRTVQAGQTVNIRGFVDGIRGSAEVEITSNGRNIASTSTDRSGYYSTYTRFNSPGLKNIEISSGGLTRTRTVDVLATATVGGIIAPSQVFESEEFELCAQVSSQVQADVVLLRNGEVMASKTGNGEVCFDTEAGAPGTAIYEVRALTSGEGGSSTRSIEVLEQGSEVESFPGQLASVESGGSIAKVELYNNQDDLKTYNLELTGIDQLWYSQSEEEVKLRSGERETVYFYLTPRAEGEYRPTLRVSSEGTDIYSNTIVLEAEGTTEPQKRSFFERLLMLLGF